MRESAVSQKEVGGDVESKLEKKDGHLGVRSRRSVGDVQRPPSRGIDGHRGIRRACRPKKNLVG